MLKRAIALLLFASLALPGSANALQFAPGDSYQLGQTETISENLYAFGGNVSVAGRVQGDLITAGGSLTLTGPVSGDVATAGGSLIVNSPISGDVRAAGGSLAFGAQVQGDFLVGGGMVTVTESANLLGDVRIGAGQIVFNGRAKKGARLYGGVVELNGVIDGDVVVNAQEQFIIGPAAIINGNLKYAAKKEAVVPATAKVSGKVTYEPLKLAISRENAVKWAARGVVGWILVKIAMLSAAALVLWWLFRKKSGELAEHGVKDFGANVVRGFVVLIVVPAAALLLAVTVVGLPLAMIMGLFYGGFLAIAKLLGYAIFGAVLYGYVFKKGFGLRWHSLVVGVIVMQLIGAVPIIGWAFSFVFFLAAFGALAAMLKERVWAAR